jgi:hypothetical protein
MEKFYMKNDVLLLELVASEIKSDIKKIVDLKSEFQKFQDKYPVMDEFLLRSKASFLADFYMGIENIFKVIANELNGGLPKGDDWHKRLIFDMTIKISGRPIVISKDLYANLLKFQGFRHIRHTYGFEIDETKLNDLTILFIPTLDRFVDEVNIFIDNILS